MTAFYSYWLERFPFLQGAICTLVVLGDSCLLFITGEYVMSGKFSLGSYFRGFADWIRSRENKNRNYLFQQKFKGRFIWSRENKNRINYFTHFYLSIAKIFVRENFPLYGIFCAPLKLTWSDRGHASLHQYLIYLKLPQIHFILRIYVALTYRDFYRISRRTNPIYEIVAATVTAADSNPGSLAPLAKIWTTTRMLIMSLINFLKSFAWHSVLFLSFVWIP